MTSVRVRGIYTTALTERLHDEFEVVQASPPIRRRFDAAFDAAPADVRVDTTDDREGVAVSGDPDGVERVAADLAAVGRDAFVRDDDAALGAVFNGRVTETLGSGAVVDLDGEREGFLPFRAVDGSVDDGDRLRVQVRDPAPPWSDDRPQLGGGLTVPGGLVDLSRARDGVSADAPGERATELVRSTEILPADAPEGWGVRWQRAAVDAEMSALGDALDDAADRATALEDDLRDAPEPDDALTRVTAPYATTWCWFGRECRFALDDARRAVETTMPGHHRTKAGHRSASSAVDFVEAVVEGGDLDDREFPFEAVTEQYGPVEGDEVALVHGKPDGRCYSLGTGDVTGYDPAGTITVRRTMRGSGTYDALGTDRERGDAAVTELTEGRWWYPTVYRGEDGERKGTYVNVCTPVEIFPDSVRYVDLHVDVVKRPDGSVERVDEDELAAAVDAGHVSAELAEKARSVAKAVESAL
ncbi:RNA-binding protein [Halobacteriales archaeon QS_9_68_17]|nr:MAG: RNA-binding protein [Halobacteriales archaeon QS_9_68_17]